MKLYSLIRKLPRILWACPICSGHGGGWLYIDKEYPSQEWITCRCWKTGFWWYLWKK